MHGTTRAAPRSCSRSHRTQIRTCPSTILHTTEALDRYADRWVDLRRAACRATYVTHDQTEVRYDAIVACFDRRRTELAAVTSLLVDAPDLDTIRHATAIAGGLTDLAPCSDGATLAEQPPLPAQPVLRAQVEVMQHSVATARALGRAGKYVAAERLVQSLIPQARALGYPPAAWRPAARDRQARAEDEQRRSDDGEGAAGGRAGRRRRKG